MRIGPAAVLAGILGTLLALPARAHDPELEMKVMLEEFVARPWVKANGFSLDFDAALAAAKSKGKPVLAYFTLSYARVPACEAVETGVFSTEAFRKLGDSAVLFLHVTSGLGGRHAELLREKGGSEVPAFMVMDGEGTVLARATPPFAVPGLEAAIREGLAFGALRAKADRTPDEEVRVLAGDMDLGNVKLAPARERVAALGETTAERKAVLEGAMLRLEIRTAVDEASGSLERTLAAGKAFAGMWAAGREPTTEEHCDPFFRFILGHAEATRDPALFRRALEKLRGRFSGKPGWQEFERSQARRLASIEEAAAKEKAPPADGK